MNGIAYDVVLTSDVNSLSKGARELLLERGDDGRAKFKTLKEKLFGYPRLALRREHSPVEETDEHVAYILAHEHELRDAFVHPTPRREPDRPDLRERTYYEFELREVRELFGRTIGLVRYIDGILDGRFGRVETWLADRDADGRFPPKTFFCALAVTPLQDVNLAADPRFGNPVETLVVAAWWVTDARTMEFPRKLAPQAGFEPATLRLTAGKRNVSGPCRRVLDFAAPCAIAHRIGRCSTFALCRALLPFAAVCCNERARKGQHWSTGS